MTTLTPHQCIQEAILNNLPEVDESMTSGQKLHLLSDSILQYLDAEGYTLVDRDAVWDFHDDLEEWLNQDADAHRISIFAPYQSWLALWRRLPPRRKYDIDGSPIK